MLAAYKLQKNWQTVAPQKKSLKTFNPAFFKTSEAFGKRLKTCLTTTLIVLSASSIMNLACKMYYSLSVTLGSLLLVGIAWLLLKKGQKIFSYILILITLNLTLLLVTYFEGFQSGVSLFFFTSTLNLIFLMDGLSKRLIWITLIVCFAAYVITFFIAKEKGAYQQIENDDYRINFTINLFLSFISTTFIAYYLARDNWTKQNSLKNQQHFLDTVFNTSLSAEIIMDTETDLVSNSNTTSKNVFRCTQTNVLLGQPVFNLFQETNNNNPFDELKQSFKSGRSWEGELTCIRKDSTVFPGSVTIVQFWYNHKRFKKITVTDISEKKRMMQELQLAKEKAEESVVVKTRFLSQMSHELRTPLNGIIGTTNLLLNEEALPQQKEHLDILRFSSQHMLTLVNEVLDLSKLDAQKIKLEKIPIDFRQFISNLSSTYRSQCQQKGVNFLLVIDNNIKTDVVTDPTRLNQVLTNLLSNAVKFTHSGLIRFEIKAKSTDSNNQHIEFNITDSGIGITPDQQKIIFEAFTQADVKTTRKYGGTGLGLNISKEIIKLLGGDLLLESEINKGSRFYFTLNMPVLENSTATTAQKIELKQLINIKVLIAEDNLINMKVATKFLDKWGVAYEKAFNGLQALELFEKGGFDIILLDLEMPELDGYDTLREIKEKNADIPALAFTAAAFQDMAIKLKQSGFDDYIQKPFAPEDLYAKLEKYTKAEVV